MSQTSPPDGQASLPPSPCVGICALQDGYCYGCGRTADEIAAWGTLPAVDQSAVWAQLPGRLAQFGFKTFRLAAGPDVAWQFLKRTFTETTGTWRLVSAHLEGHLIVNEDARPTLDLADRSVRAQTADGAILTLVKHDKIRVFGFASDSGSGSMDTIALVLPKGRAQRDLKDDVLDLPEAQMISLPEPFARSWLINGRPFQTVAQPNWAQTADWLEREKAENTPRLRLENALGEIETTGFQVSNLETRDAGDTGLVSNAPSDVKISKAFVACAIFQADDPAWLAAALAP